MGFRSSSRTGVGDRQDVAEGGAGLAGLEHHDAVRVVAELELGLRQDHPVGLDAPELRLAELLAPRHDDAGERHRDRLPGGDVRGPADDRALAVAGVDDADAEAVGVRVLLGRDDPAHHEPVRRRRADRRDALDLDRLRREQRRDLLGRKAGIAVLAQPGKGHLHANCLALRRITILLSGSALKGTAPGSGRRSRRRAEGRDAVLQHRDPLDPHAEGEPLHLLRVVGLAADEAEHVRVDHPGAEDLDPAAALAQRVALAAGEHAAAVAAEAGDVDLHAGLGEREEVGLQPRLALGPEDRPRDRLERPREVGERDALGDREPLDLVEHRQVRGVDRVAAVDGARHDDEDRRVLCLHRPHLHRRGVGAPEDVLRPGRQPVLVHHAIRQGRRVDVEAVLRQPRRMARRVVEGREVVVVVLDLRALHHPVAEADEDVLDLAPGTGQEVEVAGGDRCDAGKGHVEGVGLQPGLQLGSLSASRRASRADSSSALAAFAPEPTGPRSAASSSAMPRRIAVSSDLRPR